MSYDFSVDPNFKIKIFEQKQSVIANRMKMKIFCKNFVFENLSIYTKLKCGIFESNKKYNQIYWKNSNNQMLIIVKMRFYYPIPAS